MELRNSFIFYRSFYEAVADLSREEKSIVYDAVFEYALNRKEIRLSGIPKAIFTLIKPQLDANHKRFIDGHKGAKFGNLGADAGKLGGRPRKNPPLGGYTKPPTGVKNNPPQNPPNNNVNDNVNDNVNANVKRGAFAPPSFQDVKDYCIFRQNKVDPENFINFYQSKNWMIGKNKMADWKAAVHTWEKRDKTRPVFENKSKAERTIENAREAIARFDNNEINSNISFERNSVTASPF